MVDVDTFLTALYVMVDDFCQSHPPKRRPQSIAQPSEVIALAIFARFSCFTSERDFYRQWTPPRGIPHPARPFSVQP